MSGKQHKKLRQLARRQENKKLIEIYDEVEKALKSLVKPVPRGVPRWLWRKAAKIFLNI
jgi:hypothetical protein